MATTSDINDNEPPVSISNDNDLSFITHTAGLKNKVGVRNNCIFQAMHCFIKLDVTKHQILGLPHQCHY